MEPEPELDRWEQVIMVVGDSMQREVCVYVSVRQKGGRVSSLDECEELLPRLLLCAEAAQHAGCNRNRSRLLHAPHCHTEMATDAADKPNEK